MADDDDKTVVFVVQNEVFQPVNRFNIQVVGRLVEHDNVGLSEQRLGKQHLDLEPGVGIPHQVVVQLHGDAKTLQKARSVGLSLPAIELCKLGFQLAGLHAVFLGKIVLFIEGVFFLHDIVQVLVAHDDSIENRIGVILVLVLLENGQARAGLEKHLAGGRLQLAGENFQKRRLARAVGADDAVAVAGGKLQVDLLKKNTAAKLHGKIGNGNHAVSPSNNSYFR